MNLKSLIRILKPGKNNVIPGDHIELAEQLSELMEMGLVDINNVDYNHQGAVVWVKSLDTPRVYHFLTDKAPLPSQKKKKEEEENIIIRKGHGKIEPPDGWKPSLPEFIGNRQKFRAIVRGVLEPYVYRIYEESYFVGDYQISYDELIQMVIVLRVNVEQTLPIIKTTTKTTRIIHKRTGRSTRRAKTR